MIGTTNVFRWVEKPPTIYQKIQSLVRAGKAQEKYSLGDIIRVSGIDWQVVAFNRATPADTSLTYSMTLCTKDCIDKLQFDNRETSNPSERKNYGNNRYAHSAIRQWLNSDKLAGQWWTSQHQYDDAPFYATTKDGFLTQLDPDFLAVIGKTKIKVVRAYFDGGGSEELEDYFYLPSVTEVGLVNEIGIAEGVNFPYFNSNDRRIKQYDGSAYGYFCRTPYAENSYAVRGVNIGGDSANHLAYGFIGITPVCNII